MCATLNQGGMMHTCESNRANHRYSVSTPCNTPRRPSSLSISLAMAPIVAQTAQIEGLSFGPILALGIALCLIALVLLAVPTIFEHFRRHQKNRDMYAVIQTAKRPPTSPEEPTVSAEPSNVATKEPAAQALGWDNDKDEAAGSGEGANAILNRGKMILIADDDPVVVQALSRRLQHLGYQVFRSPDSAHALMGTMKVEPDLVILDVNMPSGNGLAVAEMMASDPRYANIPVIIHSVFGDEATKERCLRLGAHHIEKSASSWKEIKEMVESLLGGNTSAAAQSPKPAAEGHVWTAMPSAAPPVRPEPTPPPAEEAPLAAETPSQPQPQELPKEEPAGQPPPAVESAPIAAAGAPEEAPPTAAVCGRSRVLCIESPKDRLAVIEHQLSGINIEVTRISDLEEGFWTCFTEKPHVLIVQTTEGKKSLQKLLGRLADHPVTRTLPVLVVDEGDVLDDVRNTLGPNVKLIHHPVEWVELLGELERLLPVFGHDPHDPMAAGKQPSHANHAVSSSWRKPLKILCIDDDPVVARSVAIRMQPYGITVRTASNGTQGYLMATTEQPDLILLDLKMPSGEGGYVLTKLKDNDRTKHIPVIILTVESHPGVRRQLLSVGANAFLTKPMRWPELFEQMSRCIELPEQLLNDYKIEQQMVESPM